MNCKERIRNLGKGLNDFQEKHSLGPYDLIETDNYRLQVNPKIYGGDFLETQSRLGVAFPEEYRLFLTEVGDGAVFKYSSLLSLQESEKILHWDIRDAFPYTRACKPEYEGLTSEDSPESLGQEEYDRRREWMLAWSDGRHMAGTWLVDDIGCGYYRHLVVNGPERGQLWEDLRAADEGIVPVMIRGKKASFLDFYEHEIRDNLRGLENELQ